MHGYGFDPRKRHHLSAEFAKMLERVATLLEKCTSVDTLKKFLNVYSHPLYPEKRYIEPRVYCDAKTVTDIVFSLFPQYINYMEYHLLEEIVCTFGNTECIEVFQTYKMLFQRLVRKLRDHPAPVTDEEIEQSSSQKRLKVTTSGDSNATRVRTLQTLHTLQEAIEQATGVSRAGQVYAYQDPGN